MKLILDSVRAGNGYIWRPYDNSPALQLYNENDKWVCNNPNFYDELESLAHCLRVLELVGTKCIERYSPNRVAMQFRMDQDIPSMLVHCNDNPLISYSQPVMDTNLYTALCACIMWKQSNPRKETCMIIILKGAQNICYRHHHL